jgi:hypothetical protein
MESNLGTTGVARATIRGLPPEVPYYIAVKAVNDRGLASDWSAELVWPEPDEPRPDAPGGLTVTNQWTER